MLSTAQLPDDPALLKAMVSVQQAEIEHLNLVIAKLRRMQFGRRSERIDTPPDQFELMLIGLGAVASTPSVPATPAAEDEDVRARRPARKPLPDCQRPAYMDHFLIGIFGPVCDRRI